MMPSLDSVCRKLIRHGYQDRAVFYHALSRFTTIALGPLVILAIGGFLDPEQQGVYYVFGSLLQLRGLIDLGFGQSSLQLLANRYANLDLKPSTGVMGDSAVRNGFLDLAKFTLKIYLFIGLGTFLVIGILGFIFLHRHLGSHTHVEWVAQWWVTVTASSLGIATWGIVSSAEGANQLALTNRWRFWTELGALLGFLGTLAAGGGLWAIASMSAVRLCIAYPITRGMGSVFLRQLCSADSRTVDFRKTILPLQSRTMIVWGLNFVCFSAYNLLAMQILGPASAGVVGMSMQLSNMVWAVALVWYNSRLPRLGNLAGSNDLDELMALHQRGLKITSCLWIFLATGALAASVGIRYFLPSMSDRIAPAGAMSLFICGGGAYIWTHMRASYLRAFCVEAFAPLAVVQGIATIGGLSILLQAWGLIGAAITYILATTIGAVWTERVYRTFIKNGNHINRSDLPAI
ncbi:MAG: hypothetical protein KF712_09205 [Akkermansiaceae bacterium]|nr:hypothetical protein [Akkermansiaceae bacterium]